jgi:hypothetical protein
MSAARLSSSRRLGASTATHSVAGPVVKVETAFSGPLVVGGGMKVSYDSGVSSISETPTARGTGATAM